MKEGRTKRNKVQPVPLGPVSSHEDTHTQKKKNNASMSKKRPNAAWKRNIPTKRAEQPFLVSPSERMSRNVPRMARKNLSGKRGPRDVFEEEERI